MPQRQKLLLLRQKLQQKKQKNHRQANVPVKDLLKHCKSHNGKKSAASKCIYLPDKVGDLLKQCQSHNGKSSKARSENLIARCWSYRSKMSAIISKSCCKDSNKIGGKASGKANIKATLKSTKKARYKYDATKKGGNKDDVVGKCFGYKSKARAASRQASSVLSVQAGSQARSKAGRKDYSKA